MLMLFPLQLNLELVSTSSNLGLMPRKTTSREQHVDQILLPSTHLNYQSRLSLPSRHFPARHPISLSHNHPNSHPSHIYPNIYPSHNPQHLRARRLLGTNSKVLSNLSPKE